MDNIFELLRKEIAEYIGLPEDISLRIEDIDFYLGGSRVASKMKKEALAMFVLTITMDKIKESR